MGDMDSFRDTLVSILKQSQKEVMAQNDDRIKMLQVSTL